ncbi:beta-1,6-N-acetylglucosaminyltransferase [Thauera sinica]|uniref:Peptide O-xylosyltransferase n=1 Tax=Thauera sinica TaxID=2665146 RepID=A0ABW1ALX1_9RHOO|nr:beta-1,6-N-acetylglucosaminyltransferase [Thauera sp. K11]ATE60922.1 N-acetylglucosaminyltransferase [Thauera sp. K11]
MTIKCVYAIFSHVNPAQVLRLVAALRALSPQAHIVVHHDPAHEALDPARVRQAGGVLIPDPVPGEWGDWSQVLQHLHVMRWCVGNLEFDWFITLTGQSYPIGRLDELERFLASSPADAYLINFDAYDPAVWPRGEAAKRYHYRYFKLPKFRYWHRVPAIVRDRIPAAIRAFNRIQPVLRLFPYPKGLPTRLGILCPRRPFNGTDMKLGGGNQNTNYRRSAIEAILDHVDSHPAYCAYFRRTALPDEAFFATILRNSPALHIVDDSLRYIYWPGGHSASGGVMDLRHLPELEASSAYFALKFDQNASPELLDHIDHKLGLRPAD